MQNPQPTSTSLVNPASRFELAPPRRFVLPALLLLLSEQPGHGYSLEKGLREFHFGQVDRPMVYRALAHLEADGLVESWSEARGVAQARHVYRITPLGERILGMWMSVIKAERDSLGDVLRRYQATGTTDAMLAEVEGGWAAALASNWSPVSPTSPIPRHLNPVNGDWRFVTMDTSMQAPDREEDGSAMIPSDTGDPAHDLEADGPVRPGDTLERAGTLRRFALVPDRSVVLIEVRSTVGPISFGAIGLAGSVKAEVVQGTICTATPPAANLQMAVDGLRSGNSVYDAELLRRIDARRFPEVTLELLDCVATGPAGRFRLNGQLTFHGVTRRVEGTVDVAVAQDGRLVISGEQVLDIRDFSVPSPTMLMFRIYPDVRVRLHVEAELEET